jgi:hypothetical protein
MGTHFIIRVGVQGHFLQRSEDWVMCLAPNRDGAVFTMIGTLALMKRKLSYDEASTLSRGELVKLNPPKGASYPDWIVLSECSCTKPEDHKAQRIVDESMGENMGEDWLRRLYDLPKDDS